MSDEWKSNLPDADMQAVPGALARAARRAREIARQTGTAIVYERDGVLVKEMVTDEDEAAPEESTLPSRQHLQRQ